MSSKIINWFIIILVAFYTILIFATLAMDDIMTNETDKENV